MNQLISDVLTERADASTPPLLDPAALIRRARRRQRVLRGAGAVAFACAAIATGAVLVIGEGSGPAPDQRDPVAPAAADVDGWGPWLEGTTLHVADADVRVDDATMLVGLPDGGAAYGTAEGDVVSVRPDGSAETIGTGRHRYAPIVGARDEPWIAWVEGGTTADPEAVVYDVAAGAELDRTAIPASGDRTSYLTEVGGQPLGIDDGAVWLRTLDGDYRWDVAGDGELTRVLPDGPGTEDDYLFVIGEERDVIATPAEEGTRSRVGDVVIQGSGYLLSPGDRFLVGEPSQADELAIWDTANGDRIDDQVPQGIYPLSTIFKSAQVVTYALPVGEDSADVVSCDLVGGGCETALAGIEVPVLFANGLVRDGD